LFCVDIQLVIKIVVGEKEDTFYKTTMEYRIKGANNNDTILPIVIMYFVV